MLGFMKVLPQKSIKNIPCSFPYKVVCIDDRFTKPIAVLEVEMLLMNLIKQSLKSMSTKKNNEKTLQQKFDHEWRRTTIAIK